MPGRSPHPGDCGCGGHSRHRAGQHALATGGGIRYEGQIGDGAFGAKDVDLIKFNVLEGATLRIETSLLSPNPTYDTFVRLFDSAGTEIAFDDNSGTAGTFSLITTAALSAGTYYVGVSGFPNSSYNPLTANSGSAADNIGFYTLNITDTWRSAGKWGSPADLMNGALRRQNSPDPFTFELCEGLSPLRDPVPPSRTWFA